MKAGRGDGSNLEQPLAALYLRRVVAYALANQVDPEAQGIQETAKLKQLVRAAGRGPVPEGGGSILQGTHEPWQACSGALAGSPQRMPAQPPNTGRFSSQSAWICKRC